MADPNHTPPLGDDEFVSQMTASQRGLRAFIIGLIPHQVDADDLLQEVNMALWRKRHLYNPDQNFLRWAFGFAALEIRSFRSRSAQGRLWFSESAIESLATEWPRSEPFIDSCRHALRTCLEKLGEAERQVIQSKYRQRLTVKQIAREQERPASTVYKILNRAMDSLRSCVKRVQSESHQ